MTSIQPTYPYVLLYLRIQQALKVLSPQDHLFQKRPQQKNEFTKNFFHLKYLRTSNVKLNKKNYRNTKMSWRSWTSNLPTTTTANTRESNFQDSKIHNQKRTKRIKKRKKFPEVIVSSPKPSEVSNNFYNFFFSEGQ